MRLLIPSNRLKWLPADTRLAHEFCFFLHDEIVRMLVEYESANAHQIKVKFSSGRERKRFESLVKKTDPVSALNALGRHSEARRVVLNTIAMAMVSDCAHHIYEALRCFEKAKVIPGFNLLRKPLLDNLMYFTWMVADEDGFHAAFKSGDPTKITQKVLGNRRREFMQAVIEKTGLSNIVQMEDLYSIIFDASNPEGLYGLFQHAVHLVTVDRIEIKTSPENFNFIFSRPADHDIYRALYASLPTALLYLTFLIMALYQRLRPMEKGTRDALVFRAINGYRLLRGKQASLAVASAIGEVLSPRFQCADCKTRLKVTESNAAKLLLADCFQCTACRRKQLFPFSWMF
ncbi:hypothetical protein [Achromobacter insuavis]|jgi:hypothetical protein|uniref:Uncharacterized protein n=1 Tax=Achromobacter insuavis AXX-A TaxID=1003200 RepID=F7T9D5_9BURK|nr:hypothetical protein [Achromobacter insuavis]EGP43095.1 hypothetical protein AXXA_27905 [Achromobacter insuavis AXX-A]